MAEYIEEVKEVKMSNEFTDRWWDDFQDLHVDFDEIMQDEKAHKYVVDAMADGHTPLSAFQLYIKYLQKEVSQWR
jgi:hypothetical protein|tara:strand:- start:5980 stop:6204 length:225 start_codon:yes stop_codon:yes gene_type:complete